MEKAQVEFSPRQTKTPHRRDAELFGNRDEDGRPGGTRTAASPDNKGIRDPHVRETPSRRVSSPPNMIGFKARPISLPRVPANASNRADPSSDLATKPTKLAGQKQENIGIVSGQTGQSLTPLASRISRPLPNAIRHSLFAAARERLRPKDQTSNHAARGGVEHSGNLPPFAHPGARTAVRNHRGEAAMELNAHPESHRRSFLQEGAVAARSVSGHDTVNRQSVPTNDMRGNIPSSSDNDKPATRLPNLPGELWLDTISLREWLQNYLNGEFSRVLMSSGRGPTL